MSKGDEQQKVGTVIVAAGESRRMGGVDKALASLGGKPILVRVIDAFQSCDAISRIVVVLSEQNLEAGKRLIAEQEWSKAADVCPGGSRRQDSVLAGLGKLTKCDWAVIHDGARPLVTVDLIERGLEAAKATGAAVAAVPVTDTIKVAGIEKYVEYTPSREKLWSVQTPQVFRLDIITEAYHGVKDEVTDDATLVERLGHKVKLYMGSYDNIKVTTPDDLVLAETLLGKHDR